MPAEWEPHERCWMAWPCRVDFWGDNLIATQRGYADVANAIAEFEPVTMLAPPKDSENARRLCADKVTILPGAIRRPSILKLPQSGGRRRTTNIAF